MAVAGVWVELTDGNISHNHIYLRDVLDFFPPDARGGSSKATASLRTISVQFDPGPKIETDIEGLHLFLRNRSGTREFFERSGAKGGDLVLISRLTDRSFKFELVKR